MTTENNTNQEPELKPTTSPVVIGCSDLLAKIDAQIMDANNRYKTLVLDSQEARIKADVVREYKWKMEELRAEIISS